VRRPYETLAAAGAFLEVQPDHRQTALGFHSLNYLRNTGRFKTHEGRHHGTEFYEIPAGIAFAEHLIVIRGHLLGWKRWHMQWLKREKISTIMLPNHLPHSDDNNQNET
jgi:GH35 family endo-1,4-beta-xylanase